MSDDLHVGDTGTVFLVTILDDGVPVDLTSGSIGANYILFRKPDTSTMQKSASFYNDGTDGKIKYVSVDGDLDMFNKKVKTGMSDVNNMTNRFNNAKASLEEEPQQQNKTGRNKRTMERNKKPDKNDYDTGNLFA